MRRDTIKIGFVSTFSGPTAVIGNDMRNSFELALDHLGRKMGGKPVEVIYEDDGQKPDVGKQKTEKLIQSDKVDFIVGYIWSNVLLASLKTAVDCKTFLISANAGPSQLAGELCSPYVFSTSWQNDQTPQAMGLYMNQKGVKSVFLIGPNYAAGKDMLAGVKSHLQGRGGRRGIYGVAEPARLLGRAVEGAQLEAGVDLRVLSGRRRRPVPQPICAGRHQGADPALHRVHHRRIVAAAAEGKSRSAFPARRNGSTTCRTSRTRSSSTTTARSTPACARPFTARSPMTPRSSINSAVVAVKGDTSKKDAMKAEMEKANFKSVRGPFKYGNNHIPIQNFYLQDVVKDADGQLSLKTVATIVKDSQDRFHDKCPMK